MIKKWFADYFFYRSDITFDFRHENQMIVHDQYTEPWTVTVVDTGIDTMTGGRLKRIQKYIGEETFLMTYGDGVCDVNIRHVVKFHQQNDCMATLTSVRQKQQKASCILLNVGGS